MASWFKNSTTQQCSMSILQHSLIIDLLHVSCLLYTNATHRESIRAQQKATISSPKAILRCIETLTNSGIPNERPKAHNMSFFVIWQVKFSGVPQAGFLRVCLPAPSRPSSAIWNLPRRTRLKTPCFGKLLSHILVHSSSKDYDSLSNFAIIHVCSVRLISSRDASY